MTAGLKYLDEICWGTNGAIECCIEAMENHARETLGAAHPLTAFLTETREGFFPGFVVDLNDLLGDAASRANFLASLDVAMPELEKTFTPLGRDWIRSDLVLLRSRVADEGLRSDERPCVDAAVQFAERTLGGKAVQGGFVSGVATNAVSVTVVHGERPELMKSRFRVSRADRTVQRDGETVPFR